MSAVCAGKSKFAREVNRAGGMSLCKQSPTLMPEAEDVVFWLLQQHGSVGLCVCATVCLPHQRRAMCEELPVICVGCGEVGFEGTVAGNLRADSCLPMESYTCEDCSCSLMG